MTYQATVTREDGWWMVYVPEIEGLTQARRLSEAELMARELIAVTTNRPLSEISVNVNVDTIAGVAVADTVAQVSASRAEAARLEATATAKARELARELVARDIPLRDVGTILGVSHQRAHQLVNAA